MKLSYRSHCTFNTWEILPAFLAGISVLIPSKQENNPDPGGFSFWCYVFPSSFPWPSPSGLTCKAHTALVKLLWLTAGGRLICLSLKVCSWILLKEISSNHVRFFPTNSHRKRDCKMKRLTFSCMSLSAEINLSFLRYLGQIPKRLLMLFGSFLVHEPRFSVCKRSHIFVKELSGCRNMLIVL